MNIRTNIAADINRFHELACIRAVEAIDHAKQAGLLLLEAEAGMKHGDWLPWLEQHIIVSPRQVQRYMQVAQGRALPIRSIVKNDKVTHLEVDAPRLFPGDPDAAEFVPEAGQCYAVVLPDTTVYAVEPSLKHPGYFFVSKMDAATDMVEYTRRPVSAPWVEANLQYFGLENPGAADWRMKPSPGVLEALDTFPGVRSMKESIPHLDIELLPNGNIRLENESMGDSYAVDLHPMHLRLIAEKLGLVREMSASEADALRMVDKLARRLRVLHGRVEQIQKWLADAPDMESADITAEYWFNDATLDLASEFLREIDESRAVVTPTRASKVAPEQLTLEG